VAEIEQVLQRGREGAPERGFSMAMDSLCGEHDEDTLVVLARDEHGAIRGVLHFVPCYGRSAMSLSFMRRDPGTLNGLTEFLVVKATELLRARGLPGSSPAGSRATSSTRARSACRASAWRRCGPRGSCPSQSSGCVWRWRHGSVGIRLDAEAGVPGARRWRFQSRVTNCADGGR